MILQIQGLGTYDSGSRSSLIRYWVHHLKSAGESERAAVIQVTMIGNLSFCMKHKLEESFVSILHGEYFYLFIFFLHTLKRTVWVSFLQKQWWAWSIYLRSSEGLRKRCLRFELSESQGLVMNYYKSTGDLVLTQQLLEKHWKHWHTARQRGQLKSRGCLSNGMSIYMTLCTVSEFSYRQ